MASITAARTKPRPFLKWAGGKTQLLPVIDSYLPASFRRESDVTYIEPFVGGGAMLFSMLQRYPNIRRAVVNDINPRLINTYRVVRDKPFALLDALREIQSEYRALGRALKKCRVFRKSFHFASVLLHFDREAISGDPKHSELQLSQSV